MKEYTIDCLEIRSREDFHRILSETLSFPEWYGNNLDALHDCLGEIFEPTRLTLDNFSALKENLGDYAAKLIFLLHDITEENPNLDIELEN